MCEPSYDNLPVLRESHLGGEHDDGGSPSGIARRWESSSWNPASKASEASCVNLPIPQRAGMGIRRRISSPHQEQTLPFALESPDFSPNLPSQPQPPRQEPSPKEGVDSIIRQPETRPISLEQLVAEVKEIYAGLVMVESKCIEIDNARDSRPHSGLSTEQRTRLIELHRRLLMVNKCPISPALVRLRKKYEPRKPFNMTNMQKEVYLAIQRLACQYQPSLVPENAFHIIQCSGILIYVLGLVEEAFKRIFIRLEWIQLKLNAALSNSFCCSFFSEFPGSRRYACTTMPWTIWPALIILWGVCWMFMATVPGHHADATDWEVSNGPSLDPFGLVDWQEYNDGDWDTGPFSVQDQTDLPPAAPYDSSGVQLDGQAQPQPPSIFEMPANFGEGFEDSTIYQGLMDGVSKTPSGTGLNIQQLGLSGPAHTTANLDAITPQRLRPAKRPGTNISQPSKQKKKPCSWECASCQTKFCRPDAYQRHQKEVHGKDAKTQCCPHPTCKRSKPGNGFKRPHHLRTHLESCKHGRLQREEGAPGPSGREDVGEEAPGMQAAKRRRSAEGSDSGRGEKRANIAADYVSDGEGLAADLLRKYRDGMAKVEAKELWCQRRRAELEKLKVFIPTL